MMTKASSPPGVHQSKHAARSLGNAKTFVASNLCTKVSTRRGVWAMSRLSPRQTYVPKRARGGEFGQCEDLRRAKPMHQSKSAAADLGDGDEQISAGRAPIHQSKHAAGSLGNAKTFAAPNLCTKASTRRGVWAIRRPSPRQTYAPKRARGGEFGQCEDLRRAKPMYQSKSAAAGLGDDDEQISAGRAPKHVRGGRFG